jgi:hypothetical protein
LGLFPLPWSRYLFRFRPAALRGHRKKSSLLIVTVEHELSDHLDPAPAALHRIARFPRPPDYGERLCLYLFPLKWSIMPG